MTSLREELDRYLKIRRDLGYDLNTSARILRRFVDFAEARGETYVTPQLFTDWQESFGAANRQTWAARLGIVRLFAKWLHGLDPAHVPPPKGLIPCHRRRSRPYIYSMAEIELIIRAVLVWVESPKPEKTARNHRSRATYLGLRRPRML